MLQWPSERGAPRFGGDMDSREQGKGAPPRPARAISLLVSPCDGLEYRCLLPPVISPTPPGFHPNLRRSIHATFFVYPRRMNQVRCFQVRVFWFSDVRCHVGLFRDL